LLPGEIFFLQAGKLLRRDIERRQKENTQCD
jgi:hypothetical protein